MLNRAHEHFSALRVILEARIPNPAVITVGSATAGDGTEFVAFGIADSLAAAGYRTLFLRNASESAASNAGLRLAEDLHTPRMLGSNGLFTMDAIDERISSSTSREAIGSTLKRLRAEYGYVIVDAGILSQREISGVLAGLSDGTLLALRKGRSRTIADKALAVMIDSLNVLGVVSTSRSSLDAFAKLDMIPQALKPRIVGIGNVVAG